MPSIITKILTGWSASIKFYAIGYIDGVFLLYLTVIARHQVTK